MIMMNGGRGMKAEYVCTLKNIFYVNPNAWHVRHVRAKI